MTNTDKATNTFKVTYQPKNFEGLKPFGGRDKATPRPWHRVVESNLIIKRTGATSRYYRIAKIEGGTGKITDEANTELIVRCVNSHDALVEACKNALNHLLENTHGSHALAMSVLSEVISKVERGNL